MKIPKIGKISSGTLRPEDLIDTFLKELKHLLDGEDNDLVNEATNWIEDSEGWGKATTYYDDGGYILDGFMPQPHRRREDMEIVAVELQISQVEY